MNLDFDKLKFQKIKHTGTFRGGVEYIASYRISANSFMANDILNAMEGNNINSEDMIKSQLYYTLDHELYGDLRNRIAHIRNDFENLFKHSIDDYDNNAYTLNRDDVKYILESIEDLIKRE